jgi:hypothetical protein
MMMIEAVRLAITSQFNPLRTPNVNLDAPTCRVPDQVTSCCCARPVSYSVENTSFPVDDREVQWITM